MQTSWWIADSAPPSPEKLGFLCKFVTEQILPQLSSSLCWISPHLWRHDEPDSLFHSRRIHTLCTLALGCVPRCDWTQHPSVVHPSPLSLGRLSHHPSRLSSMLSSVLLGSSALISEMWLGIAQPELHMFALNNPRFLTVKAVYCFDASSIAICQKPTFRSKQEKYSVSTRLSMASCTGEADRNLSWFWHWANESPCKNADLCLICAPILLHYTMDFDWDGLCLLPKSPSCVLQPHPPWVEGSIETTL